MRECEPVSLDGDDKGRPVGPPGSARSAERLLCFQAGGQEFGAPIRAVKETLAAKPLTRVFLVPAFVSGLMNLRGEVVAVLDLARLVGLPPAQHDGDRRRQNESAVVILRSIAPGKSGRAACGIAVDRLLGVRDVTEPQLQPPPTTLEPSTAHYLKGVAAVANEDDETVRRPVLVLDPERVLDCEPLRPYRRARAA